ncbi:aminoacyl-tRNA hydrolase [Cellulophaga baltica]|uniref:aminoacyl-tRNA hydrolase n=1 Tax=Cellulophaga TaxID=104264 RepID=UPI001C07810C|nr:MULTISPECIES: aminoacyl-tRNA hydrolase [Cellulophaga]MBU2997817.1 aminoacyl-tRNA hydrolase [Cellulophaga baltica]MDO6769213.1 aminoacyl-tRNA hydrolase [Cellulophaga sp. 1_MG-2023]
MFGFLKSIFSSNKNYLQEVDSMKKYLVIGLGNIGPEYAQTRHNIGFKILDALANKEDLSFNTVKLGDVTTYKVKGRSVLLLKPSTYMNLSGKAVQYWMQKENIPVENILVITDDINLDFGTIRVKTKGSNGGHNGLKDIQQVLNSTNYNRFRFGVGADFGKGRQVDYVLGKWTDEERDALKERLAQSTEVIKSFVLAGVERTMNTYNGS